MGVEEGGQGGLQRDGPLRWALTDDWSSQADEGEGLPRRRNSMCQQPGGGESGTVQCPGSPDD